MCEHWNLVADVAEESLRENKKRKQDIRVVSAEFTIDFSRETIMKAEKIPISFKFFCLFSRPADDSMIKNPWFEQSYSSLMSSLE